jgi:hypothetical protein
MLLAPLWTLPAHALSCKPAKLNHRGIESHTVIFEGTVEKIEMPSFFRLIKDKNIRLYTFHVTRHWYGEGAEQETISILASPGWAQKRAYEVNKSYMVFGRTPAGNETLHYYEAHPGWCGFDINGIEANRTILEDYTQK